MAVIKINRESIKSLLTDNKGKMFGAMFKRVNPKCETCGKSNKKWIGEINCPKCGDKLSYVCQATGLLGVKNPGGGITKPGEGGVSATGDFKERLANGYLTYYSMNADGSRNDGKTGGYRMFKVTNLFSLKVKGAEFEIVD